jgi:hypothetical protein
VEAAAGFAGFGATEAGAPAAGALGFGAAAGAPAAGAFAAGGTAAGFAAAAGLGAGRKKAGVGRIPDFVNSISIIKKKIPLISIAVLLGAIPSSLPVASAVID